MTRADIAELFADGALTYPSSWERLNGAESAGKWTSELHTYDTSIVWAAWKQVIGEKSYEKYPPNVMAIKTACRLICSNRRKENVTPLLTDDSSSWLQWAGYMTDYAMIYYDGDRWPSRATEGDTIGLRSRHQSGDAKFQALKANILELVTKRYPEHGSPGRAKSAGVRIAIDEMLVELGGRRRKSLL